MPTLALHTLVAVVLTGPTDPTAPPRATNPPVHSVWGEGPAANAVAAVHRGRLLACFDARQGPACLKAVDGLPSMDPTTTRIGFVSPSTLAVVASDEPDPVTYVVHPGAAVASAIDRAQGFASFAAATPRRNPCSAQGQQLVVRQGQLAFVACRATTTCSTIAPARPRALGFKMRLTLEAAHATEHRLRERSRHERRAATYLGASLTLAVDPVAWARNARAVRATAVALKRCQEAA